MSTTLPARMTKGDRLELTSLIKKRERVMRAEAHQRSAELLAEFDAHSAKIHDFDDDAVWKKAEAEARAAVEAANGEISKRCEQMGIPREFAPGISFHWHGRGHNAVSSRRVELRRAAKSRIEALEAQAIASIERISLQAQSDVLAEGLESDSAKLFLKNMPALSTMMPSLNVGEIQKLIETQRGQDRYDFNTLN